MYDLRFSMYDLDYSARCAGEGRVGAVSAYGQRVCAAPQGRVGNGVPTSQRTIWIIARQRRGLCKVCCLAGLLFSSIGSA